MECFLQKIKFFTRNYSIKIPINVKMSLFSQIQNKFLCLGLMRMITTKPKVNEVNFFSGLCYITKLVLVIQEL